MPKEDAQSAGSCSKGSKTPWAGLKSPWLIWLLPIIGFFSLIWFLIRVIPKPSRATYPCQRLAFPWACGFITWIVGLAASAAAFRKAKTSFVRCRYFIGALCLLLSVGCVWLSLTLTAQKQAEAAGPFAANNPIGVPRGLKPGRVVWVYDPNATNWDGQTGYWYQHVDFAATLRMLSSAIRNYAESDEEADAWDEIFRHFNRQKDKGDVGYAPGEKITIKLNLVTCFAQENRCDANYDKLSQWRDNVDNTPELVYALLDQLVNVVGVAQSDITIGDPTCLFPNYMYNFLISDFPNVRYWDNRGTLGRTRGEFSSEPFYWSRSDIAANPTGVRQDFVPVAYAEASYVINFAILKSHNSAGMTCCAKNHYGSMLRLPTGDYRDDDGVWRSNPSNPSYYTYHSDLPDQIGGMGHYRNLVDLMGHEHIGGKTLLYLIDGIFSGRNWEAIPQKWNLPPFGDGEGNESGWPCSIFLSMDPVAIDSVAFDFMYEQWGPDYGGTYLAKSGASDFLVEAALADNPPSGTFYDPDHPGNVSRLPSLGVHEHWNNPIDKQYSGNLGIPGGIELVKIPPDSITGDIDEDRSVNLADVAAMSDQWLDCIVHSQMHPIICFEAEHYSMRTPGSGPAQAAAWHESMSPEAFADKYVHALPDSGLIIDTNIASDSPHLGYLVNFAAPGTFYLWFKGAAADTESDSLHYGLDGAVLSAGGKQALLNKPLEEVLIAKGSDNWLYLDIGSEQSGWTELLFDDASWRSGRARFGYGNDGEITEVRFGPNEDNNLNDRNNKYITTYFRKHFTLDNAHRFTSLTLSILRDDGAAPYINARELPRTNMPAGPIDYNTIVRSYAVSGAEEDTYFDSEIDPNGLREDDNVIAVEVHQYAAEGQNNITSSDMSFDLELTAGALFSWRSECANGSRPVIHIPTAGIHSLEVWMRKDGAKLDRILLTNNETFDPAEMEPADSPRTPFYNITADINNDGIVDFADFALVGLNWLKTTAAY